MTLDELKHAVDFLVGRGYGSNEVVITTRDSAVGGRAYSKVTNICQGMDWEKGQIRISPVNNLVTKEKYREKVLKELEERVKGD